MNRRRAIAKIASHLRTFAIAILILLTGSAFAATEAPELRQLRDQLKKAQDAQDKPAIIELSRRIVGIVPNDSATWDTLAQTQLESEELDGLERTLNEWQKAFKKPPAAIEDFRAGLCFKRKDYQCAEQHWRAFIATKPPRADVATDYDNLAELCAAQSRWADHAAYRAKAIAAQDTVARRVLRAVAFLRLRNWDAAYADMSPQRRSKNSLRHLYIAIVTLTSSRKSRRRIRRHRRNSFSQRPRLAVTLLRSTPQKSKRQW